MFRKIFFKENLENEEKIFILQNLLDSIANPIFYKDRQGVYRGCNQAFANFFGLPFEKIIGKTIYELTTKELADIYHQKDQELFRTPGIQVFESEIPRSDGALRKVIFNKATYKDIHGVIIGIVGSVIDITEQKQLEKELKKRVEEWGRTFDSISDGIFIIDVQNTIQKANRAFARLFNANPEDLAGRKCYELVHQLNQPWPNCPLEKTLLDKKSHTEEVNDPRLKCFLLVTTSPILDAEGKIIGAVHVSKDITRQKDIENELKNKVLMLERFQKITVGRELKMKELKACIAELEKALGKEPREE